MKERESGIDLLRCTGLLFVVSVHFFLYNGFYNEPQTGLWMWAADSARWLFFACNGIYMTLTGYLKSTQPLNRRYYRGLVPVLLGYAAAAAVSIPVRHFFMGDPQTFAEWLHRFMNFSGCYYGWYVKMYIGLLLFSPVINLALRQLHETRELLWLAGTMVLLTALPSVTDWVIAPNYWTGLYPFTYYVIGAVIRRTKPQTDPRLGIGLSLLTAMGLGAVTVLSTGGPISEGYASQGFGGFWITLTVAGLFLALYRLRIGPRLSNVLAWAAGGCFEGYLLSHLLDGWVYRMFPAWCTPPKYVPAYFCLTVPVFILSLLSGRLLHGMTAALANRIFKRCSAPASR